jgi:hypothetical protein
MVHLIIPRHHALFMNPVGDAVKNDVVMRALNDIGRTLFANSQITVDLLPSIAITILSLLAIYAVLSALGVLPGETGSATGYGYSATSSEYSAPSSLYARVGESSYYKEALGDLQERIASLKESPVFSYSSNAQSTGDIGYTA